MSRSHEASRGACLESTELGSGGGRSGSVSGGAQTGGVCVGGGVIVPSGRWGWAQELIGSLGVDAEQW